MLKQINKFQTPNGVSVIVYKDNDLPEGNCCKVQIEKDGKIRFGTVSCSLTRAYGYYDGAKDALMLGMIG